MSLSFCRSVILAVAGLIVLTSLVVYAQSTTEDGASCVFDEAVNLLREDLRDLKSACASNRQHSSPVDRPTSSLCKY